MTLNLAKPRIGTPRIGNHPRIQDIIRLLIAGTPDQTVAAKYSNKQKWPDHTFTAQALGFWRRNKLQPIIALAAQNRDESEAEIHGIHVTEALRAVWDNVATGMARHNTKKDAKQHIAYIGAGTGLIDVALRYELMLRGGPPTGPVNLALCIGIGKAPGVATVPLVMPGHRLPPPQDIEDNTSGQEMSSPEVDISSEEVSTED